MALSSLASGRETNRIVSKPVHLRNQLVMGDITSANTYFITESSAKGAGLEKGEPFRGEQTCLASVCLLL